MSKWHRRLPCIFLTAALTTNYAAATAAEQIAKSYQLGRTPSQSLIDRWDIAIGPAGDELPKGQGTVEAGAKIYATQCAACHGPTGREGPDPKLVGGVGSLASEQPVRTVGSYWPHATTLYDYIYRAMPFVAPGSLTPDQVYSLCAYLLHANGILDEDAVLDRVSLPAVEMPNRGGFYPDPRPDVAPQQAHP